MDQGLQTSLIQFFQAALGLIVVFVGYLSAVYGQKAQAAKEQLKAKIGSDNWETGKTIVETLVKSAQQKGIIGEIENDAQSKKDHVLEEAQKIFSNLGINFDVQTIEHMLESAIIDGVHKGAPELFAEIKLPDDSTKE